MVDIAVGDLTEIGSEIAVKVLRIGEICSIYRPVVIGDTDMTSQACHIIRLNLRTMTLAR